MRIAPIIAALLLYASQSHAKVTETTDQIGSFILVTRVDDISDTPIMHAPLITKEVHLEWRTADGRALFGLHDDGGSLRASYGMTKPDGKDQLCGWVAGGKLLRYPTRSSARKDWLALRADWIANLTNTCKGAISVEQVTVYRKEMEAAEANFLTAIETMKSSALEQFGSVRRCLKYKQVKGTWADLRCVRQSEYDR